MANIAAATPSVSGAVAWPRNTGGRGGGGGGGELKLNKAI